MIVTGDSFPWFYQSIPGHLYNWVMLRKYLHKRNDHWQYRQSARNASGNLRAMRDQKKRVSVGPSRLFVPASQLAMFDFEASQSRSVSDTPTRPKEPSVNGETACS